jgi:hypothetical protein
MSSSPVPASQQALVILWAGENEVLHAALVEQLELAGIPYVDQPIGDEQAAPTADPLPIDWKPRFGFRVAVPSTRQAAGGAILERLLEQDIEQLAELPAAPDGAAATSEAPACRLDEAASVRVWTGGDAHLAKFVEDSLRENEITVRAERAGEEIAIFIPPSCEVRAREIIREVTQGTPPN